jgi:hypothetical protein
VASMLRPSRLSMFFVVLAVISAGRALVLLWGFVHLPETTSVEVLLQKGVFIIALLMGSIVLVLLASFFKHIRL